MKLSICFLLLTISSLAVAKMPQLDKFILSTGIKTEIVEATDQRARVFGFDISLDMEDKIDEDISLFLDFSASFQKGSNETLGEVDEFAPIDGLNLNKAGVKYTPFKALSLKIGALDQGEAQSPLLIGNTAFAGAEEKLTIGMFYIKAIQAIPSNNKLSTRLGEVEDSTPYFGMEVLGLKLGSKRTRFQLEVGHFAFKDLSSNIANASKEFGNSTNNASGDAIDFLYEFEGTNAMTKFEHIFQFGMRVLFHGQYLYNEQAPEERNTGFLTKLGLGSKNILVYVEQFENQSDTSPGFYNSKYYGHNNMNGNSVGLDIKGKSYGFNTRYTQANVIEDKGILQDDIQIITFNLVRDYEI